MTLWFSGGGMGGYRTSVRTRQALIDSAGELGALHGLGHLSTRAIAEHAGENAGSIHYHFGGKEGLIRATLDYAMTGWFDPPLPEYIAGLRSTLGSVDGQTAAVRAVVRRFVWVLFESERPDWCSRLCYQVAQHPGPLRQALREEVVDPEIGAISDLLRLIRPDLTEAVATQWALHLLASLILHADYSGIILARLGSETFPEGYFDSLERRIVHDTLRALGLPLPKDLRDD